MQTTSLKYFLAVARCGSIAAASERLNVATSAISRQIANLEAELGCALFERVARGMVPSPAGDLPAHHANHILLRADQATNEIMELQGLRRGLVRVATTEGFALDLVPRTMADFHARYPGIQFELAVMPPSKVTQVVSDGEADIGLTFALGHHAGVQVVHEVEALMIGICALGHPLAGARSVPLHQLESYPVVMMPEYTTSRQVSDAVCRDAGVNIEPVLSANTFASILSFIKQTQAVAALASMSIRGVVQRGEFASFTLPDDVRASRIVQVQIGRNRTAPKSLVAFTEELIAEVENKKTAHSPSSGSHRK